MSVQSVAVAFAEAFLKAVAAPASAAPASSIPAAATATGSLTAGGLTAFVNLAGPIVRIVEGKGTLADDADAVNAVLNAVTAVDPAAVPMAALIEAAEPAFGAIVGLVRTGVIQGGQPDIMGEETDRNFKNR